jgi:hypothetical protein
VNQSYHIHGFVELLAPLSHGGDTEGTIRMLRREKFRQPDGTYERVPVYSGNAFRGQLRDAGTLYMLRRMGVPDGSLSVAAFYFLFSGGALSKEPGMGLDIDRARELRRLIPHIGVFGGAVGRQLLAGKLHAGRMIPVADETKASLPAYAQERITGSVYEALQVLEYTRTDDAKNEHLAAMLPVESRRALEGPRVKITADGDEVAAGGAQQMRYGEETLASGTLLWHEMHLEAVSDLELAAFTACLYVFSQAPYIGGNARIGHGKVAIRYNQMTIDPLAAMVDNPGTALSLSPARAYEDHLDAHAGEILDLLGTIR